jgi:hypothetical protein
MIFFLTVISPPSVSFCLCPATLGRHSNFVLGKYEYCFNQVRTIFRPVLTMFGGRFPVIQLIFRHIRVSFQTRLNLFQQDAGYVFHRFEPYAGTFLVLSGYIQTLCPKYSSCAQIRSGLVPGLVLSRSKYIRTLFVAWHFMEYLLPKGSNLYVPALGLFISGLTLTAM